MRLATFAILLTAVLLPASTRPAAQAAQGDAIIAGRIVDSGTQAPIAGARVILLPAPAAGRLTGPMGIPTQVVTGDDGVYTLTGVSAGRYRVQVQKPGFVAPAPTAEPGWIQVGAGRAIAGPDFRLNRGAAIAGRVVDARGEGLPELMVMAVSKPGGASGRGGRGLPAIPAGQPGQTNDIGEFRITGLPAGEYYVTVNPRPSPFAQPTASSSATPVTTFYPGVADMAGAQVIGVAAGQTISGLAFTILSARGFAVSGVVVDEMNRPVGGAMVMLMPNARSMVLGGRGASTRTRPDGTFTIGGVVPGAYRLNASVPVTFSSGSGTVTGGVSGGVTSGAGGIVSFSSSAGAAAIQLTVGDADVAGLTVVVRKPAQ